MDPSPNAKNLVKTSESCRLTAYQDVVGVWTIGYGHTGPEVVEGLVWTQGQADNALENDLKTAGEGVGRLVKVSLTQGQFDALTDLVFNMGAGTLQRSTLLRKLNAGNYSDVPFELFHEDDEGKPHGFIFAGGEVQPGLITRRKKEIELWNS